MFWGCCRVQFSARCCSCWTPLNYCNSSRAMVFVRIFMLTIHRSMKSVSRTNRSRNRSFSRQVSQWRAHRSSHLTAEIRSNRSTTNRRLHHLPRSLLRVGADLIDALIRNLGIFIDADLPMRSQVIWTVPSCFSILRQLYAASDDQGREPFFSRWCRHSFSVGWTMVMPHCLASMAT